MAPRPRLILRADGDSRIGGGHVSRLLALAEAHQAAGGKAVMAAASIAPALAARASAVVDTLVHADVGPGSLDDASWTVETARRAGARWVAIDGDAFGAGYQQALRAAGLTVLMVDDYGRGGPCSAHVVVNPNVFATEAMYEGRAADTRLLLGPAYALLGSAFAAAGDPPPAPALARRVLVTLGGADPEGLSAPVAAGLVRLPHADLQIEVIVGGASPPGALEALQRIGDARLGVRGAVEAMAPVMRRADVAITGAGVTVYELCALGVPAIVVPIVPGQGEVAAALDAAGLCRGLGASHPSRDPEGFARAVDAVLGDRRAREALSRQGRACVDGRGAERIAAIIGA